MALTPMLNVVPSNKFSLIQIAVFWIMTVCNLVGNDQHFGGTYCLPLQDLDSYLVALLSPCLREPTTKPHSIQMNPVSTLTPYFYKVRFNIILLKFQVVSQRALFCLPSLILLELYNYCSLAYFSQ
jgi:hypothetical protein